MIIRPGDDHSTFVFDARDGSAAYAIWVQLVAQSPITLLGCGITSQLDDQIVLASFPENSQFGKHGAMEFPKREVLNSRLENRLPLRSDQVIEGTILAWGQRPIPAAYWHGAQVPCTLAFYDQDGNKISRQVSVYADRTWKSKKVISLPHGGLYGGSPQPEVENINETMRLMYLELTQPEKAWAEREKKKARISAREATPVEIFKKSELTDQY